MNATLSPPEALARAAAANARGDLAAAEALCRTILAAQADYFDALHLLAVVQARRGRATDALAAYDRALAVRPDHAEALNNRGIALKDLKRFDDAIASYDRALAVRPDYGRALYNRGVALQAMNRWRETVASFARAVDLQPDYPAATFALCMAELPLLYTDKGEIAAQRAAYARRLKALCESPITPAMAAGVGSSQPYYLAYQGQNDRDLQAQYGDFVCKLMAARYSAATMPPPPAPGEPLRVGLVSGFFRMHSNWKQPISGWLTQLDRSRYRIFGYHTARGRDGATETAARLCARFVQGPLSVERWRAEIAADAPHVLIYPEIGMDTAVPALAAQRLAPVQCAFWGHPETSGFPTIDYFLSSDLMEPPDGQSYYTEQLVRLPNLSIWYEQVDPGAARAARARYGLRDGATLYWCGQTTAKYLPQYDDVLVRIAQAAGDCQFAFISHSGGAAVTAALRGRLERAFAAAGLKAADYCVFLPRLTMTDYIAAMGLCDVFLDSIGWSGGNTTLESLAHDLPVITLPGAPMRARHSMAILRMMGVTETIAGSLDDYVALAVRAARDRAWRMSIKAQMAANKQRVYRDRTAIDGLERFLDRVGKVQSPGNAVKRAVKALEQGRLTEAERLCRTAVTADANDFEALHTLAVVLSRGFRLPEALTYYDRALALRPSDPAVLTNRANVLSQMNRFDEALASFDSAIALQPRSVATHYNRSYLLRSMNRRLDAQASYERVLALDPNHAAAWLGLCVSELPALYESESDIAQRRAGYAARLTAMEAAAGRSPDLAAWAAGVGTSQPFLLAYQGLDDRDLQARYGALMCRIMAARYPAAVLPRAPAPREKLRVGIVSGFMRWHSNWKMRTRTWLSQLDRARFHVLGYHTGTHADAETRIAKDLCDRFVQGPLPIERWRAEIAADAPHVLIYPEVGMDPVAAALAAQRLAPVQCNSWGHPDTSGFPTMDYFLTSDLMEPPNGQSHYTERLVRLPGLSVYYEPAAAARERASRDAYGVRAGACAYWCCQSLSKFLPQHDDVFARIARDAGDCQFVFIEHPHGDAFTAQFRRRLERAFAGLGLLAADHCVFLPRLDARAFLAATGMCDVFLDSIAWSGCNTTLESLVHDQPIVTLPGALMRGRHSAAILQMMGVTETIAASLDDYVQLAARMARDPAWRRALGAKIAAGKHRVYRDRAAIAALEQVLDRAGRQNLTA